MSTMTQEDRSNLWVEAFDDLSNEQLAYLGVARPFQQYQGSISWADVVDKINQHRENCEKKSWKVKFRGQQIILRDLAIKTIHWLQKFREVGDIIVQYDPVHAALPWAVCRFILQSITANERQMGLILISVERLTHSIHFCILYEELCRRMSSQPDKMVAKLIQSFLESIRQHYRKMLETMLSFTRILSHGSLKKISTAVTGPEEVEGHMSELERQSDELERLFNHTTSLEVRSHIDTATKDLITKIQEVQQPFRRLEAMQHGSFDILKANELREILNWCSTIKYGDHHSTVTQRRMKGSGNWLLHDPNIRKWHDSSSSSVLLLEGQPGAGKTFLISRLIDWYKATAQRDASSDDGSSMYETESDATSDVETSSPPLAAQSVNGFSDASPTLDSGSYGFFYCKRDEEDRRTVKSIFSTLVRQIAVSSQSNAVLAQLRRKRERYQLQSRSLDVAACRGLLLASIKARPMTMIFLDALDECERSERNKILKEFKHLLSQAERPLKILLTSRPDFCDMQIFDEHEYVRISATDSLEDIERYIDQVMGSEFSQKLSTESRKTIKDHMMDKCEGMFQWVVLHLDDLAGWNLLEERNVLQVVEAMPAGLNATYDQMYNQILSQPSLTDKVMASRALFWLLACPYNQLGVDQLLAAICINPSTNDRDERPEGLTNNTILSLTKSFLVINENENTWEFTHLSAIEYLESDKERLSRAFCYVGESCMKLLLSGFLANDLDCFEFCPNPYGANFEPHRRLGCFCNHVSLSWPDYVALTQHGEAFPSRRLQHDLCRFLGLGEANEVAPYVELFQRLWMRPQGWTNPQWSMAWVSDPKSLLFHWTTTERSYFLDCLESFGCEWTTIAARMGSKTSTMVEDYYTFKLHDRKTDWVNLTGETDRGRIERVKGNEQLEPQERSITRGTPRYTTKPRNLENGGGGPSIPPTRAKLLVIAISVFGFTRLMEHLLDPRSVGIENAALHWSEIQQHEPSALRIAIKHDNSGIADALLDRGFNLKKPPLRELILASKNGDVNLVRRLLSLGANPDSSVEMAPGRKAQRPDDFDSDWLRAVDSCAGWAPIEVTEYPWLDHLINRQGADVNQRVPGEPEHYNTALNIAATQCQPSLVLYLLGKGASVDIAEGLTGPLNAISHNPNGLYGDENCSLCLRLLLSAGANVNHVAAQPEYSEQTSWTTPLIRAIEMACLECCTLLLQHGADPNLTLVSDDLTLSFQPRLETHAVQRRVIPYKFTRQNEKSLCKALNTGNADNGIALNMSSQLQSGSSPLALALADEVYTTLKLYQFRRQVAELLMSRGADLNHRASRAAMTPLAAAIFFAIRPRGLFPDESDRLCATMIHAGADVEQLSCCKFYSSYATDKFPMPVLTPLGMASCIGDLVKCRLLLQAGANINRPFGGDMRTPVAEAALRGHTKTCRELIRSGANVHQPCGPWMDSPFTISLVYGKMEACQLLLEQGANVNQQSDFGPGSALAWAVCLGCYSCCRYLMAIGADPNLELRGEYKSALWAAIAVLDPRTRTTPQVASELPYCRALVRPLDSRSNYFQVHRKLAAIFEAESDKIDLDSFDFDLPDSDLSDSNSYNSDLQSSPTTAADPESITRTGASNKPNPRSQFHRLRVLEMLLDAGAEIPSPLYSDISVPLPPISDLTDDWKVQKGVWAVQCMQEQRVCPLLLSQAWIIWHLASNYPRLLSQQVQRWGLPIPIDQREGFLLRFKSELSSDSACIGVFFHSNRTWQRGVFRKR